MGDAAVDLADLRRLGTAETLAWWFKDTKRPHNFNGLCRTLETLIGYADKYSGEHMFPSFGEVARVTGTCYRTVQRHVLELERLGVLRKLKSFISSLRLPYEFSLSRRFALRLLRKHAEAAKGWVRIKIGNSIRLLERTGIGDATSVAWRRRNPITKPVAAAPAAAPSSSLGGIGQIAQLPPALRAGEWNSSGPDASGAGPSPLSSRSSGAPAGANPVSPLRSIIEHFSRLGSRR